MGADHVAFGAIYPTTTKGVGRGPQGPDRLRQARAATNLPLVAIGGIGLHNLTEVVRAGAGGVAVISAASGSSVPSETVMQLCSAIETAESEL